MACRMIRAALLILVAFPTVCSAGLLNEPFFPEVQTVAFDDRTLAFAELGDPQGTPLLFAVGFPHAASTGAGVLSPFDNYLKRQRIRLIAIERTGATFRSSFDVTDTLDTYVSDVASLTHHLDIDRFAVMAFSAGGPGALALAAQMPERVRSLHLMSARGRYTDQLAQRSGESDAFAALTNDPLAFAPFFQQFPPPRNFLDSADVAFLDRNFGPEFVDFYFATAIEELEQNPEGLSASRAIAYQPWSFSLAEVTAPVFIYQGWEDRSILPGGYSQDTAARVGGLSSVRFYPGESHFHTHLRHFDQVIADLRYGGQRVVMCRPQTLHRRSVTRLVPARSVNAKLQGGYRYGNCFWQ